jgi:hypothetical protein
MLDPAGLTLAVRRPDLNRHSLMVALQAMTIISVVTLAPPAVCQTKQLFWGDTHLHTSNSFDAYLNRNTTADPDTAYRYAKGLPVIHPYHRARVQIETPLDFLVVSDHAEYLGVVRRIVDQGIPTAELGIVDTVRAWATEYWLRDTIEEDAGMEAFRSLLPMSGSIEEAAAAPQVPGIPGAEALERSAWLETIEAADAHNAPGTFTALIGWEWSSIPAGANLHRVVLTSAGAGVASKFRPWSSVDSQYPEDLWAWLDETSAKTGAEFVAIPHNSNISKGAMFTGRTLRGEPLDAELARRRAYWEPVAEITQIKGDSETHPSLSPDDPFADFETYPFYIQQEPEEYRAGTGDYIRSALRLGLALEQRIGVNPYRFGLIGSTDSHTGMASAEEPNFWGKLARDSIPENKGPRFGVTAGPTGWSMSASGLAAVWAEENSREAILAAFRRREVFATSGPRIAVQLFAGWEPEAVADTEARLEVPMGGTLPRGPKGSAPRFLVHALKDPKGANLDRIQIVKGWLDAAGETHEKVFDVAWSGERTPGADGALPPVGNTVDPATARYTNEIGSATLSTIWRDPEFDPTRPGFYYARILEIPTPRHSTFDALALGRDPKTLEQPWSIQERAYTSPIWYAP